MPDPGVAARPDCLLIEGCDFVGFPPGGQLACARQLMRAFGRRLALVGICTDRSTPTGRWTTRVIDGEPFHFYGVGRSEPNAGRPLVPARLTELLRLARHRAGILSLGVRAALLQAPEDLLVVSRWRLDSLCYWFPGVENPLHNARYPWAKPLASAFDRLLFAALERADVIVASADGAAIDGLVARSAGRLARERVHQVVTHYDGLVFRPESKSAARARLAVAGRDPIVVCSGRLNRGKGWDLVLEAFRLLARGRPGALLVFVGDGEDREAVERAAAGAGLADRVRITGFVPPAKVALWLNAADVVAVGSHREGWSVAMLEGLACGKPIVSTAVSGAHDMIVDGANGFVVESRSPEAFRDAMERALALPAAAATSLELARRYDLAHLAGRVGAAWKVLS